jgi:hypothetical protein
VRSHGAARPTVRMPVQVRQPRTWGPTRLLGDVTILLGLFFADAFERLALAGRIVKPFVRPGAGLAGRRCPA